MNKISRMLINSYLIIGTKMNHFNVDMEAAARTLGNLLSVDSHIVFLLWQSTNVRDLDVNSGEKYDDAIKRFLSRALKPYEEINPDVDLESIVQSMLDYINVISSSILNPSELDTYDIYDIVQCKVLQFTIHALGIVCRTYSNLFEVGSTDKADVAYLNNLNQQESLQFIIHRELQYSYDFITSTEFE